MRTWHDLVCSVAFLPSFHLWRVMKPKQYFISSPPLFRMHEFVCLDIVLNLVFMKFNAKRLWASTIRMLSYSCLSVCLRWQCVHSTPHSCALYIHVLLLCMPSFCFVSARKKKTRRDSIEFTHKLVSLRIAVASFCNHKILQLQHDVLRVLVNPKINITATALHPPPPSSHMMTWNWRASGGFLPFSFRQIHKRE